jgi:hypothetical protein
VVLTLKLFSGKSPGPGSLFSVPEIYTNLYPCLFLHVCSWASAVLIDRECRSPRGWCRYASKLLDLEKFERTERVGTSGLNTCRPALSRLDTAKRGSDLAQALNSRKEFQNVAVRVAKINAPAPFA